jgi:hypothetical protein
MNIPTNYLEYPFSTYRLREIKNTALVTLDDIKLAKYIIIHSVTIHIFKDCILVFGMYEQGSLTRQKDEALSKNFAVYSKDLGKTWHEYKNQFEPAEGGHKAFEYKPHDAPFPTKTW